MTDTPQMQDCPICREPAWRHNPRYPYRICRDCLSDGIMLDGKLVSVKELDMRTSRPLNCRVKGVECIVQEAYMGGTIVNDAKLHLLHKKAKGRLGR